MKILRVYGTTQHVEGQLYGVHHLLHHKNGNAKQERMNGWMDADGGREEGREGGRKGEREGGRKGGREGEQTYISE